MRRARLNAVLLAITLFAPLIVEAQPTAKIRRIGTLAPGVECSKSPIAAAFREALQTQGWVIGQTLRIEGRCFVSNDQVASLLAELTATDIEVLAVWSTAAALAAKRATTTIPVVFASVADPVGTGVVASLARPERNLTGFSIVSLELTGKRLELLRALAPWARQFGLLLNQSGPTAATFLKEARAAATAAGIRLRTAEASSPDALVPAVHGLKAASVDAVLVQPDPMFWAHRTRLVELMNAERLPAIFELNHFAEAGGLMSYGTDLIDVSRRVAEYVHRVLGGTAPAELPVQQPGKFELVINLSTAKTLGLAIPPSLALRADRIIE